MTAVILLLVALLTPAPSSGTPFTPTPLTLDVSFAIFVDEHTNFTTSGMDALVRVFIYARMQESNFPSGTSGFRDWHYVNRADTCVHISPVLHCAPGKHTYVWDGRDMLGERVRPFNPYSTTYKSYVIAIADTDSPTKASEHMTLDGDTTVISRATDGTALTNPILQRYDTRWTLGSDPTDTDALETTSFTPPVGWTLEHRSVAAPSDPSRVFLAGTLTTGGTGGLFKYAWTPGKEAPHDKAFNTTFPVRGTNPVVSESDGNYVYVADYGPGAPPNAAIHIIDHKNTSTGEYMGALDFSPLWGYNTPGTPPVGPDIITSARNAKYYILSSRSSGLRMCFEPLPYFDDLSSPEIVVRWMNGNGDYILDRNWEPSSPTPWVIHDGVPAEGPVTVAADRYGFSLHGDPSLSPGTLALLGPDGTGVGTVSLGESAEAGISGMHIISAESAYDGLYYSVEGEAGVRHRAYATGNSSFRFMTGQLVLLRPSGNEVVEASSTYEVHFRYPYLIKAAPGGSTPTPATTQSYTLEFSADHGNTWSLVSNNFTSFWQVPDIESTDCLLRITENEWPYAPGTSQRFTIARPVKAEDAAEPHAFSVSAAPNPFNATTTITLTLPARGTARIAVYSLTGQRVREFIPGQLEAGIHSFAWDGRDNDGVTVASGIYIIRGIAGALVKTVGVTLVK